MSKQRPVRNVPIVKVAPISKKLGAGSTAKSGSGFTGKSSTAKIGSSFGAGGKTGTSFGSNAKSSTKLTSTNKSSSAFGSSGKTNSSLLGSSASAKTGSFLGSSGKSSSPPIIIAKTANAFNNSPSKSNPSTSFSTPKKPSTTFGIIWIPTKRRHKKKEYVHVSHRYDDPSKERSPSMYPQTFMSGDSPAHLPFKKKDEESLLIPERPLGPIATAASAGAVVASVEPPKTGTENEDSDEKAEKQEFIRHSKEDSKEAAGDTNYTDGKKDYLENDSDTIKSPDSKSEKEKGDNVDSVYLRAPPPHKIRSNTSNEEEDCGIKCLYYTLQCCDCVLM